MQTFYRQPHDNLTLFTVDNSKVKVENVCKTVICWPTERWPMIRSSTSSFAVRRRLYQDSYLPRYRASIKRRLVAEKFHRLFTAE